MYSTSQQRTPVTRPTLDSLCTVYIANGSRLLLPNSGYKNTYCATSAHISGALPYLAGPQVVRPD